MSTGLWDCRWIANARSRKRRRTVALIAFICVNPPLLDRDSSATPKDACQRPPALPPARRLSASRWEWGGGRGSRRRQIGGPLQGVTRERGL
ncbi:hypothetical protein BS50DRAFT_35998 [Corynespora cassiicola Philippines]|uniref:Uncharacterized protein n=1 Tax=Corynespora cassiicola Philippines TaxID=1448308 RepID=A0A2T2PC59_CORCC|nr:hypothetical protein BS50DRAFT_35998 [Corynespora cassiicola Philippines]